MLHALIVEDDADSAEVLAEFLKGEGLSTATASSVAEARQQLALREPDVILLDLVLPDGDGMRLFADDLPVANSQIVLITGHASVETSVQALRLGAADYLTKPVNLKRLKSILSRLGRPADIRTRMTNLEHDVEAHGRFGWLWGRADAMRRVYDQIARVAGTAVNVLITGESGTGKELVAATIHDLSPRHERPFLAVNCGAISPQLIESELFGHEKGSFTGAQRQHHGYFERANGGTLLLDEVTEMPAELQVKLLRVLETGEFLRIGADEPIETDVRILASSNRIPSEAVADGRLREDLFYRLNVFDIYLPALRERREDIALLAGHFLDELNAKEDAAKHFSPAALARLREYPWPGNVRELRNVVQRSFIMAEGEVIDEVAVPVNGRPAPAALDPNAPAVSVCVGTSIADMERRLILATLEHVGGHRDRAAEILGVSPKTLYNRLREYRRARSDGDAR